jgi:hypothetical protein
VRQPLVVIAWLSSNQTNQTNSSRRQGIAHSRPIPRENFPSTRISQARTCFLTGPRPGTLGPRLAHMSLSLGESAVSGDSVAYLISTSSSSNSNLVSILRQSQRPYGSRAPQRALSRPKVKITSSRPTTLVAGTSESGDILREPSNFCCLPGRAGGSPVRTSSWACTKPMTLNVATTGIETGQSVYSAQTECATIFSSSSICSSVFAVTSRYKQISALESLIFSAS